MRDPVRDQHVRASRWQERGRVVEAALLLMVALFLVRWMRFGRWWPSLGHMVKAPPPAQAPSIPQTHAHHARALARMVDRAQARLRYPFKCLPRAMALQWMLRRRRTPARLIIGIARGAQAGRLGDLHAWVEVAGVTVIGAATGVDYRPFVAFAWPME